MNFQSANIQFAKPLQASEQCEFELIVTAAKRTGWLQADDRIAAAISGRCVTVEVTRARDIKVRSYECGDQWLFEFLSDLAEGAWNPPRDEHFGTPAAGAKRRRPADP